MLDALPHGDFSISGCKNLGEWEALDSVILLPGILKIQHQVQGKVVETEFAQGTQTPSGQFNGSSLAEAK